MRYLLSLVVFMLLTAPLKAATQQTLSADPAVLLSWTASTTPGVTGYNVYRFTNPTTQCSGGSVAGFTLLNSTPVATTTYTDSTIVASNSYCYGVTAVSPGGQSLPSNLVLLPQGPQGLTETPQ